MACKAKKWTPFFGNPHLNEPLEEDILGKDDIRSSHGVASNLTQLYFLWDPEMESKGQCELAPTRAPSTGCPLFH
jgi:hypothetical protein